MRCRRQQAWLQTRLALPVTVTWLGAGTWGSLSVLKEPVLGAFQSCLPWYYAALPPSTGLTADKRHMCVEFSSMIDAHSSRTGGAGAVCPAVASADATGFTGASATTSGLRGEVSESARRVGCAAGAGLPYGAVAGAMADARGLAAAALAAPALAAPALAGAAAGALAADASSLADTTLLGAVASAVAADTSALALLALAGAAAGAAAAGILADRSFL